MKTFRYAAVALVAASFALSASAMTSIQDTDLAQISGQEGVSIIADLNVNIGAFTYTDDGASVAFNNIDIKGLMVATIDVLQAAVFQSTVVGAVMTQGGLSAADAAAVVGAAATATGYTGQDVVQFAFPGFSVVSINVASMTTGHGGASFGGVQIKNLDIQGTKVWLYGH